MKPCTKSYAKLGYLTGHADCDASKLGMMSYVEKWSQTVCKYELFSFLKKLFLSIIKLIKKKCYWFVWCYNEQS